MLIHVPLNQIDDNPFQRRQDYGDVDSLAADIQARGLLQVPLGRLLFDDRPISAEKLAATLQATNGWPGGAAFSVQLAFGHRRLRAFRCLADRGAGWATMPVYVEALDDDAMLNAVWSENQHRSDINPIEQAELLAQKLNRARAAGGNQSTVAAEWGLDRSTIANKLRLLDLPPDVQAALRQRRLSERQALALLPVVELQEKVNGAAVKWDQGKKPELYGPPITPAAFLAHAVANPDKATSDTIRDYARRAADHAGRPLPDYLAQFDAGPGDLIVQPTCAGCPHRHNQHCLRPPCHDAKWALFQSHIPALAADHAGLPWCADPAAFPNNRADAKTLHDLYTSGRRDNLVVGWADAGYKDAWLFAPAGHYQNFDTIRADWRKGLLLGRLPQALPAPEEDETEQPPTDDWWCIKAEAENRRRARVQQALTDALERLLDDRAEQLRPLLYLFSRRSYGYTYRPTESVADALRQLLDSTALYSTHPYDSWADLFTAIGLDPARVDPPDPTDDLREDAAVALADWARNRGNAPNVIRPIAVALGQALNAFEAAGITAEDEDAGLAGLARWLPTAYADAARALNSGEESTTAELAAIEREEALLAVKAASAEELTLIEDELDTIEVNQ